MRKLAKRLGQKILVPYFKWYLKRERKAEIDGIKMIVFPGVFHPTLFHSTPFLFEHLKTIDVTGKRFLELGCGSALLAIAASKRGADVTASDISDKAIKNAKLNAVHNGVDIRTIKSDVFDKIDGVFDVVVINPPYYPRDPGTEADYAWFCGRNFEYFQKLFSTLKNHIHAASTIAMVLTKGCDIQKISSIAQANSFELKCLKENSVFFDEKDFIFSVTPLRTQEA